MTIRPKLILELVAVFVSVASCPSFAQNQAVDAPDAATSSNVTTTGGTVNTIPLFTTSTNIQNSILTQTGTTGVNVLGKLTLPATGAATSGGGKNSRSEGFVASAFNSSTSAAVAQTFQLQAEPAANNSSAPSGTLNLLYGSGTAAPTETGLKISSKGVITFAASQTFPGGGSFCIATAGGAVGAVADCPHEEEATAGGAGGAVVTCPYEEEVLPPPQPARQARTHASERGRKRWLRMGMAMVLLTCHAARA